MAGQELSRGEGKEGSGWSEKISEDLGWIYATAIEENSDSSVFNEKLPPAVNNELKGKVKAK